MFQYPLMPASQFFPPLNPPNPCSNEFLVAQHTLNKQVRLWPSPVNIQKSPSPTPPSQAMYSKDYLKFLDELDRPVSDEDLASQGSSPGSSPVPEIPEDLPLYCYVEFYNQDDAFLRSILDNVSLEQLAEHSALCLRFRDPLHYERKTKDQAKTLIPCSVFSMLCRINAVQVLRHLMSSKNLQVNDLFLLDEEPNAFLTAVKFGAREMVSFLVSQGVDPRTKYPLILTGVCENGTYGYLTHALHYAVAYKQTEIASDLLPHFSSTVLLDQSSLRTSAAPEPAVPILILAICHDLEPLLKKIQELGYFDFALSRTTFVALPKTNESPENLDLVSWAVTFNALQSLAFLLRQVGKVPRIQLIPLLYRAWLCNRVETFALLLSQFQLNPLKYPWLMNSIMQAESTRVMYLALIQSNWPGIQFVPLPELLKQRTLRNRSFDNWRKTWIRDSYWSKFLFDAKVLCNFVAQRTHCRPVFPC